MRVSVHESFDTVVTMERGRAFELLELLPLCVCVCVCVCVRERERERMRRKEK